MGYNEQYKLEIADALLPTPKNVAETFVTYTMKKALLDENAVNFNIRFEEPEAIQYIGAIMEEYIKKGNKDFIPTAKSIIEKLTTQSKDDIPTLVIRDYNALFEILSKYYEKMIELFFARTKMTKLPSYEIRNCLEHIWLRATPEDFNNAETFLLRQMQMINDTTLSEYNEEQTLGAFELFDNHIVTLKNEKARIWDESDQEVKITLYEKDFFDKTNLWTSPHLVLTVIRYGIYEKDGRQICRIGSIQNKREGKSAVLPKLVGRRKYKVNSGIEEEWTNGVEPMSLISLCIFINCLHQKGITCIEAPSMYVLDYQYHQKRNKEMLKGFNDWWTPGRIEEKPEEYKTEKEQLISRLDKEDIICRIKSENFLKTLLRLMVHFPNVTVESYPGEVENFLRMNVPIMQEKEESVLATTTNKYRLMLDYKR